MENFIFCAVWATSIFSLPFSGKWFMRVQKSNQQIEQSLKALAKVLIEIQIKLLNIIDGIPSTHRVSHHPSTKRVVKWLSLLCNFI